MLDDLQGQVQPFEPGTYCPWEDHAARWSNWLIELRELPKHFRGCTDFDTGVITLDQRLNQAERRATLSHEWVHVELGHDRAQPPAVEAAVEQIAATRLIDVQKLERAAFAWGDTAIRLGGQELDADNPLVVAAWAALTRTERKAFRTRLRENWADCWIP